jgi:hypothetical protein
MESTMANKYPNIILIVLAISLLSCNNKLGPKSYLQWFKEDGARITKEVGNYRLVLVPLTAEYLALKSLDNTENLSKEKFSEKLKNYEGLKFFLFRIGTKKGNNSALYNNEYGYAEYAYKLDYLTFGAQNDYKLVAGNDTMNCVLYNFENNFNTSPNNDVLLAFKDNNKPADDYVFQWNDRVLGIGTVNINVSKSTIEDLPELELE